jgi:hypothetical protein
MIDQAALAIKRNGVGLKGNIDTNHNNPASYSVNVRLLLEFILNSFKKLKFLIQNLLQNQKSTIGFICKRSLM